MSNWLLYGANGYTATLIIPQAKRLGMKPILAGRSAEKMKALGEKHQLPWRAFDLNSSGAVKEGLKGVDLVLHCAGPFEDTAAPMVKGCLEAKAHYLDITGEIGVFEALAKQSEAAKKAGICLLPGVGFDVVPSDCLLKTVSEKLPEATELELGIWPRGGISPGTTKTMLRGLPRGNWVRRQGKLKPVPLGTPSKTISFLGKDVHTVAIPWGDLATAYYSTGVPNITVYSATPKRAAKVMRAMNAVRPVLGLGVVQNLMSKAVDRFVPGPTEAERKKGKVVLWAKAKAGNKEAQAWLEVTEGYEFTAAAALESVQRILKEPKARTGFLTPSLAFGSQYVSEIGGKFTH